MDKGILLKLAAVIALIAIGLYSYIEKQNRLTSLKIEIFDLAKEIDNVKEKNSRLMYEIEQFENPAHLLQLVKNPEFSHLRHPLVAEVLSVPEGMAFKELKKSAADSLKKHALASAE